MPPPELHRQVVADRLDDLADHRLVDRDAGAGAVQVDDVQPSRSLRQPVPGHRDGIVGEHGHVVVHVALPQANTVSVLDVDSRYQEHADGPARGRQFGSGKRAKEGSVG